MNTIKFKKLYSSDLFKNVTTKLMIRFRPTSDYSQKETYYLINHLLLFLNDFKISCKMYTLHNKTIVCVFFYVFFTIEIKMS